MINKNKKPAKIWGKEFISEAKKRGYIIKKPTTDEFDEFINFILVGKGKTGPVSVRISLKSRKKTNRKNKKPNDNWAWVELRTVDGQFGWLYGGSDLVVFELENSYVFVNRKRLLQYVNSNIDFDLPFVQNSWEAKYKIYQREGKLDQITQVKMSNILSLENVYQWEKSNEES